MKHYSTFIKTFTILVGGIVAFSVGLAAGYVVFHPEVLFTKPHQSQQIVTPVPSESSVNKTTAFRLDVQQREQEYITMLLQLTRSTYDGAGDISAVTLQVNANANERAELYGEYFGNETKDSYKKFQDENTNGFIAYTNAVKRNNKIGMDNATKRLISNIASQSAMLQKVNKELPANGLNKLSTDKIILLKESIDAYADGNYPLAYSKQREAFAQTSNIATAQANAIIKMFPEKFK